MQLVIERSPKVLNLKQVNLKTQQENTSDIIDFRDYRQFGVHFIVNNTGGGAAGAASLKLRLYADDETTILATVDLLTSIATTADRNEVVTFGRGLTPAKQGNGTLGSTISVLKCIGKAKVVLDVTTASDGTTCVGDVYLKMGN